MAKKYLKNSEGTVRAITSDNLGLEKPLANENYDIEVHNRNMDKIDGAVTTNKSDIATNKSDISNLKTKTDATNTNLSSLQTKVDNGQNHKITQDDGCAILISNTDLNDLNVTGTFQGSTLANSPDGTTDWFYIESIVRNSLFKYQRVTKLNSSEFPVYDRVMRNGAWSSWREL